LPLQGVFSLAGLCPIRALFPRSSVPLLVLRGCESLLALAEIDCLSKVEYLTANASCERPDHLLARDWICGQSRNKRSSQVVWPARRACGLASDSSCLAPCSSASPRPSNRA